MYIVKCFFPPFGLVKVFCCSTLEVANYRMKLYLLESPGANCEIQQCVVWTKSKLSFLKKKVAELEALDFDIIDLY